MDHGIEVLLSPADVTLLVEALDAYEYWQLGDILPRDNGAVFIPGDVLADEDRFWGHDPTVSPAEAEAIEQVQDGRRLAERLIAARDATPLDL